MRNTLWPRLTLTAALALGLLSAGLLFAQQELILKVPEGEFVFRDLALSREFYGSPRFSGKLENRTSKDWDSVNFEIALFDIQGNLIGRPQSLLIFMLKRGTVEDISRTPVFLPPAATSSSIARYEIRFTRGEYPATSSFVMSKPKESKDLRYDDDLIEITFTVTRQQIGFDLRNKTAEPITVDWNSASYVDVSGNSHRVMHSGVRYVDRDKPQAPSIIPPTARLKDMVQPTDYVEFLTSIGWSNHPLFPKAPDAAFYKGKTFSVFLSLQVEGKTKNYLFTFSIENVEM